MILQYKRVSPPAVTWRERLANVKQFREEYRKYQPIMTQFERELIERDIKSRIEAEYPSIQSGVISEFEASLEGLKAARAQRSKAYQNEAARWDMTRMAGELQAVKLLVDLIPPMPADQFSGRAGAAERLAKIYAEAKRSGDMYRIRAAAEVLSSVLPRFSSLPQDTRIEINGLAMQAERDLVELHHTDETRAAEEAVKAAAADIAEHYNELEDVHQALIGSPFMPYVPSGPFEMAARRVGSDPDSGELVIYEKDSPEVTGVYWRHNKPESEQRES